MEHRFYMHMAKSGLSERTISNYLYWIQRILKETGKTAETVEASDIEQFLRNLSVSPSTCRVIVHAAEFLARVTGKTFLVGHLYPVNSPARRNKTEPLSREELERLLHHLPDREYLFVSILLETCLQVQEILKLKSGDIQGTRVCGLPINPTLSERLRFWIDAIDPLHLGHAPLFPGRRGCADIDTIRKSLRKAAENAGIPQCVNFHVLKATADQIGGCHDPET